MSRLLIAVSFFLQSTAWSRDFASESLLWLDTNAEKLLCGERESDAIPVIHTIGSLWLIRDGALGFEVSDHLGRALECRPEMMLVWFERHESDFDAWVSDAGALLLTTDSESEVEQLRGVKLRIIRALSSLSKTCNSNCRTKAERIISALSLADVQLID